VHVVVALARPAEHGLGSPASLRVHLARDAGTSPTAYRAACQGRKPNFQAAEKPRPGAAESP
jgi:hypothetical protein